MGERPSPSRRLFVGVALDDAARAACADAAERLRSTGFAARYEAPEKLHITLAFLGNVAHDRYDAIAAVLPATAARCKRLSIAFDRVGAFPHERKPRVVYLGARSQGAPFRMLSEALRGAYLDLGFSFKDDAVAHVTIARVKDAHRPLAAIEFDPIPVEVDRLTLFESIFDPKANTTRYEIAESAPLSKKLMEFD